MKLAFVLSVILLSLLLTPSVHASPVTVTLTPSSQVVPQGSIANVAVGLSAASVHGVYKLTLSGLYSGLYSISPFNRRHARGLGQQYFEDGCKQYSALLPRHLSVHGHCDECYCPARFRERYRNHHGCAGGPLALSRRHHGQIDLQNRRHGHYPANCEQTR